MRLPKAFYGFKPGTKVKDAWFKEWGVGTVVRRTRTRLLVRFPGVSDIMEWDGPHVRAFLRKA